MYHYFIVPLNGLVQHILIKETTGAQLLTIEVSTLEGNVKYVYLFFFLIKGTNLYEYIKTLSVFKRKFEWKNLHNFYFLLYD